MSEGFVEEIFWLEAELAEKDIPAAAAVATAFASTAEEVNW